MANGRCRLHGGKSTGPRTAEGLARLAAANTTHGDCAQAGHGAKLRVADKHHRVLARRARLKVAAYKYLPWLPRAFAARLLGDAPMELDALVQYPWFPDGRVAEGPGAEAQGQAAGAARRDARGRFAAAPPPPLRGRAAERARARAEAAALAPWRAAIKRARLVKRVMLSQERAARGAQAGQEAVQRPAVARGAGKGVVDAGPSPGMTVGRPGASGAGRGPTRTRTDHI
jgi:hypothetical protein